MEDRIITGLVGPYAITASSPAYLPLLICGEGGKELVKIDAQGGVFWRGREVESDEEFKSAMRELAEQLVARLR